MRVNYVQHIVTKSVTQLKQRHFNRLKWNRKRLFSWIMDSSCALVMKFWPHSRKRLIHQEFINVYISALELKQTAFTLILKMKHKAIKLALIHLCSRVFLTTRKAKCRGTFLKCTVNAFPPSLYDRHNKFTSENLAVQFL